MAEMKRLWMKLQEDCQHVWTDWGVILGMSWESRYCVICKLEERRD